MKNENNSCYQNSIIQSLFNLESFLEYLQHARPSGTYPRLHIALNWLKDKYFDPNSYKKLEKGDLLTHMLGFPVNTQ